MGRPRPPARYGARTLAGAKGGAPLQLRSNKWAACRALSRRKVPPARVIVTGWPRRLRRLGEQRRSRPRVERDPPKVGAPWKRFKGRLPLKVHLAGVPFGEGELFQ
jgi:hypothetical protein